MSYSQMIEILKEKHKEEILFVKTGTFYIAFAEDAVLLNSKLKLKCICFKNNICKIGIPVKSMEKYLEKIEKLGYSYVVYSMNKEKIELVQEKIFIGKRNKTKRKNINCLLCKGIKQYYDDVYMEALKKMYERENKE